MTKPSQTGPHWAWLNSPSGDPALAILEVWISDLRAGRVVVSVLQLLEVLQAEGFGMGDQSNFLRWLRRGYGAGLVDRGIR